MSSENSNLRPCRPSEAITLIERCARLQRSAFIWGPPGIGKSAIIFEIAKSWSPKDSEGEIIPKSQVLVYDVRLLLMEPTDLRGMPFRDGKVMRWSAPVALPPTHIEVGVTDTSGHREVIADEEIGADDPGGRKALKTVAKLVPNDRKCILFLDELTAAPASIQASAYQLVHDRRIGDYVLPKNCSVVAAGNRQQDRGVVYRMPTPLRNRFLHFEMESDLDDWMAWAIGNRVHPQVIGYLQDSSSDLFVFDPKSEDSAFPTPRTWEMVSDMLWDVEREYLNDHLLQHLVFGAIGSGTGVKFMGHRDFANDLPKVADILSGTAKKMGTKNISAQYFLSASLCYKISDTYNNKKRDKKKFDEMSQNYFRFILDNFEREIIVMSVRAALKDYKISFNTKDIKAWDEFYHKFGNMVAASVTERSY